MITLSINVTKINKSRLKRVAEGKVYANLVLLENRDGPDQYGNDGFVSESVTKEEREAGIKGDILGNWKRVGKKPVDQSKEQRDTER